ncbi:hypothetical protein TSUD_328950 [Trifolium subterraneum]|uniref:Uncharacterized protein n=1 Tax=Trifolium subterraneum TaxID=3900 RepID=A0A2Z6MF00_TRISU|nr:hypothetical protein TSUD_328950 [Trifolium subterraneum]
MVTMVTDGEPKLQNEDRLGKSSNYHSRSYWKFGRGDGMKDRGRKICVWVHGSSFKLEVSGDQLLENGASGNSSIGTFLGWAMTFVYLSGRMPQIFLNIRRGHAEVRDS